MLRWTEPQLIEQIQRINEGHRRHSPRLVNVTLRQPSSTEQDRDNSYTQSKIETREVDEIWISAKWVEIATLDWQNQYERGNVVAARVGTLKIEMEQIGVGYYVLLMGAIVGIL